MSQKTPRKTPRAKQRKYRGGGSCAHDDECVSPLKCKPRDDDPRDTICREPASRDFCQANWHCRSGACNQTTGQCDDTRMWYNRAYAYATGAPKTAIKPAPARILEQLDQRRLKILQSRVAALGRANGQMNKGLNDAVKDVVDLLRAAGPDEVSVDTLAQLSMLMGRWGDEEWSEKSAYRGRAVDWDDACCASGKAADGPCQCSLDRLKELLRDPKRRRIQFDNVRDMLTEAVGEFAGGTAPRDRQENHYWTRVILLGLLATSRLKLNFQRPIQTPGERAVYRAAMATQREDIMREMERGDFSVMERTLSDPATDYCQSEYGPAFCANNLGIPRTFMPQVASETKFVEALYRAGVPHRYVNVRVGDLRNAQADLLTHKLLDCTSGTCKSIPFNQDLYDKTMPVIISSDNGVIDGHHRKAMVQAGNPDQIIRVLQVGQPLGKFMQTVHTLNAQMPDTVAYQQTQRAALI